MNISGVIRQRMTERDITAYRLSKETGIDEAQLSRFFKGDGSVGLSVLKLIQVLDYLGLELRIGEKQGA